MARKHRKPSDASLTFAEPPAAVEPAPEPAHGPIDFIPIVERLRESQRRWRQTALASIVLSLVLTLMNSLQFAGTFLTSQMLHEARREGSRSRGDSERFMTSSREVADEVLRARQEIGAMGRKLDNTLARCEEYNAHIRALQNNNGLLARYDTVLQRLESERRQAVELLQGEGENSKLLSRYLVALEQVEREGRQTLEGLRREGELQRNLLEAMLWYNAQAKGLAAGAGPACPAVPATRPVSH